MRRIAFVLLLLTAAPVSAEPIFATIENRCVPFVANAEVFWWSAAPFRFASFWSLEAGCAPTVDIPTTMYERIDNFDGSGGLAIRLASEMLFRCGRGQWDAGDVWYLIVDMGIDCADYNPATPPPIVLPPETPVVPPDLVVDFVPPDTSGVLPPTSEIQPMVTTGTPPPVTIVPEPGTLGLLGAGLWGLARLRRLHGRTGARDDSTIARQPD
jgi:PEP-CTERM motif